MDVFKLLSRSSKSRPTSSATHAAKAGAPQTLPSSGAAANPQLFGHHGPVFHANAKSAGKGKRKRGLDKAEAAVVEEDASLYAGLDFFGAQRGAEGEGEGGKRRRKEVVKESAKEEGGDAVGEGSPVAVAGKEDVYDAAESKRLLRSHKLKVAVLEDFAEKKDQKDRKDNKDNKDKKSKKRTREEMPKKPTKKTLYPHPLTDFAQLRSRYAISKRLALNIQEQGYKLPTEVQLGALPLLLGANKEAPTTSDADVESSGAEYGGDVDLLTIAPTGSGKTIAFLIPVMNALLSEGSAEGKEGKEGKEGPRALVVAPTRELAAQIVNEARKLAKGTGIKATLMRKGMEVVERGDEQQTPVEAEADASDGQGSASESDASGEVQQKKRRAELVKAAIIVATPLALLNALRRRDGTVTELSAVRHLVLDEADVLLDPLFRDQTLAVWNACTNPLLRIGLWSATMGASVESLAVSTLNLRWAALAACRRHLPPRPPLIRLVVGLKDTAIPNIHHQLTYAATEQGKLLGLRQLLHPTSISSTSTAPVLRPPFLVFTQTIPRAIALHSELLYDIPPEAGGSSRMAVLHADLSSSARDTIMTRFRKGEIWVLITTDLLARGVDFRGLNGVVNFDAPTSAAAYVHRVGRTGRAGRTGGVAVTLYTQDDVPYVRLIANVIRASETLRGIKPGDGSVKQWLLDALPMPSKRDKKTLKQRGVESRRSHLKGKEALKGRISTKSGFERREENNRKGAKEGNRRRERAAREGVQEGALEGFEAD